MADLRAAEWAVHLATLQDWHDIILEGDALMVIKALKKDRTRGLHSQVVINNIHSLTDGFQSI